MSFFRASSSIYQYDPLGAVSPLTASWGANIFTPTADESLVAVGLYALADSTSYEIYIYDDFSSGSFSNLLHSQSGSLDEAGYYTIDLTSNVSLTNGDDFAIVTNLSTPGTTYSQALEYAQVGYSSLATANPGESYYSTNGSDWTDLTLLESTANLCIKGLTEPPEPKTLTVSVEGTGLGSVTSSPTGIDCGSDCSETYAYDTVVTLTATEGGNSEFKGWSGGGCSGVGTCEVTMNDDITVTAIFDYTSEYRCESSGGHWEAITDRCIGISDAECSSLGGVYNNCDTPYHRDGDYYAFLCLQTCDLG